MPSPLAYVVAYSPRPGMFRPPVRAFMEVLIASSAWRRAGVPAEGAGSGRRSVGSDLCLLVLLLRLGHVLLDLHDLLLHLCLLLHHTGAAGEAPAGAVSFSHLSFLLYTHYLI